MHMEQENILHVREEIQCNNIIRKCKKLLILMMLQKKNIKGHNSV